MHVSFGQVLKWADLHILGEFSLIQLQTWSKGLMLTFKPINWLSVIEEKIWFVFTLQTEMFKSHLLSISFYLFIFFFFFLETV